MITQGDASCFTNGLPQNLSNTIYGITEQDLAIGAASDSNCSSLLYNLSILKDKVHHIQSSIGVLITHDQNQNRNQHQEHEESTSSMAMATINTLVQEVIVAATSMMFTCQQMGMSNGDASNHIAQPIINQERVGGQSSYSCDRNLDNWYGDTIYNNNNSQNISIFNGNLEEHAQTHARRQTQTQTQRNGVSDSLGKGVVATNCDIIELDAADILAKYTHYCHVCGKGFKRDANLRMHMRAHGDEYKTPSALTNPMKKSTNNQEDENMLSKTPRKYSCPQEGCRWNKKHEKFQPLKSMICVKNHYKRSHCPKMYVCKRCNQKQFSVLSDLRTHEKHCGDLKWQCSCGTTFSRKDKLMGHVALFVGHTPAVNSSSTTNTMVLQA